MGLTRVRQCAECGSSFGAKRNEIYCSARCGDASRRKSDQQREEKAARDVLSQRRQDRHGDVADAVSDGDPDQISVRPHDLWKASSALRRKRNSDRARLVKAHKVSLFASGSLSCAVCGWNVPEAIADESTAMVVHMHHVVPVACGGSDDAENLVALCPNHHTIAHRIGTQKNGRWFGAESADKLVSEIHQLERDPESWTAAQFERRRVYVLRDDTDAK